MNISFESVKNKSKIVSEIPTSMVRTLPNRYNQEKLTYPQHKLQAIFNIKWPGHYVLYTEPSKFDTMEIAASFLIRSLYDKQLLSKECDIYKMPVFFRIAEHLTNDLMNGFGNPQIEHLAKSPIQWIHNLDGVNYGIQKVISNHILQLIMNSSTAIIVTTTTEPSKWLQVFDRSLYTQIIRLKPIFIS